MPQLQLDPSLKLTFCPRCDYSLNGLPETGICPECGEAYTTDFIIIRGRPVRSGDEPNGQQDAPRFLVVGYAFFAPALVLLVVAKAPGFLIAILVFFWAFGLLRFVLVALSAVRKREVLVWLAPAGIREQPFVDPDSLAGKYLSSSSTIMRAASFPLAVAVDLVFGVRLQIVSGVAIFAVLFVPSFIYRLGRKPTISLSAKGIRPALLPWKSFGMIEVEELGNGAFQLWARRLKLTRIRKMDVIKIEFKATESGAVQLFDLIRQWAGPSVPVVMKPMDRTSGPRWARDAGLLIGRLVHRE